MNLTAVAVRPINEALKKATVMIKHTRQVNFIEAIAAVKRAAVSFFLTGRVVKRIQSLYGRITKVTEPILPVRKFKRSRQPKRNQYTTYKIFSMCIPRLPGKKSWWLNSGQQ
jgi:hypothetical protein